MDTAPATRETGVFAGETDRVKRDNDLPTERVDMPKSP